MTKKTILWVAVSFVMLGALGFFVYRLLERKGGDWMIQDTKTKCLTRPLAIVPSRMPQRKAYVENSKVLSYEFPSWWKPLLDDAQYKLMPAVDTVPVTRPIYEKILANGKDVWFTYSPNHSLARYDTQSHELKLYSIPDNRGLPLRVSDIFLAENQTLWTILNSPQPSAGYSVLARYQPDTDAFEIITDEDDVLTRLGETSANPSSRRLAELPDGQLAIVMNGDIYLFDPFMNRAKLLLDNGNVESIATGKEDSVWFVNQYKDVSLRVVNTRTGEVTDYGTPPQLAKNIKTQAELLEASKAIAVDQQGRVWVSYFDRLEPIANGQYSWHSIDLPSVFVNTFDPYYSYRWANVYATNVFSNGDIWFTSDIGIVKYDVSNAHWCLSAKVKTLANYPIAEDSNGDIWTIVDNQIYKKMP
jgi:streptogramin lyase